MATSKKERLRSRYLDELPDKRLTAVYMPPIEPLIQQTNRAAIDLLVKIKEAMTRLNREKEFADYFNKRPTT